MPFGIDFKSFVVGALFVYFLLPMIMGFIGRAGGQNKAA